MTALAWVIGIVATLFLVFRFPRQIGLLFLVLVVVGLGIGGYFYAEGERTKRDVAAIDAKASANPQFCKDPAFPIWVTFLNNSGKTLEYVSFSLKAQRPNYSGYAYTNYQTSDRIIPTGEGFGNCWSLASYSKPDDAPSSLQWSVEIYSARFR